MCLDTNIKELANESGSGFKVLNTQFEDGSLQSPCYLCDWTVGEWVEGEQIYIYVNRDDAKNMLRHLIGIIQKPVLCAIEYEGAYKTGLGDGGWNYHAEVIVARRARVVAILE